MTSEPQEETTQRESVHAEPDEAPTVVARGRPAAARLSVGSVFGEFELQEELGRGGMGVVFRARQKALDRLVALKMILPGPLAHAEEVSRFRTEAEAAARLQHPNIVAVHGVGVVDGQHYYSMEYIEGPSLAKLLAQGPLPGHLAARHVMTVARAIHYAHSHGILHRDLKPSNILLDVGDQPHITDFGLAKKLDSDSGQTRTGAVMGTPSYMAPEQAAGKTKELGPPCDIYGLGAVLYELITGQPLFHGETTLETLQQVLEKEPTPPREIVAGIERDLETICLKCLQKDPRERYATAAELADDLQRYLNGEAIAARSFGVIDRLARTLDRSQLAREFHGWGTMLIWIGVIVFLGHLATFTLIVIGQPRWMHWLARSGQFALIAVLFWRSRSFLLPRSTAERQLWSIWLGYLIAYGLMVLVRDLLIHQGMLGGGPRGEESWDELMLYPISSVLTGMAFFAMGGNYWGRCYLFGLAFFVLAALMPFHLTWSPLALGIVWCVTLIIMGMHVHGLGREKGASQG